MCYVCVQCFLVYFLIELVFEINHPGMTKRIFTKALFYERPHLIYMLQLAYMGIVCCIPSISCFIWSIDNDNHSNIETCQYDRVKLIGKRPAKE